MRRKLAILLSLAMILTLLVACADPAPAPAPAAAPAAAAPTAFEGEIAFVAYYTGIPFWNDGLDGMEAAAAHLGINFCRTRNFHGPLDGSPAEQSRIIDELVAGGIRGLVVYAACGYGVTAALNRAMAAGVPVVLEMFGVDDDNAFLGVLGGSAQGIGATGGAFLAEQLGGVGQVGILTIPAVPSVWERAMGYVDYLSQFPGIEIIEPMVNTDAGPDIALERTIALIQANPGIRALVGTDSVGGAAAARAVLETGRDDIIIVGMDRDADLLGYIQDGVVAATVATKCFSTKWLAVHYIYWILNDLIRDVPDWRAANIDPMPRYTDTGSMLITQNNVHFFIGN